MNSLDTKSAAIKTPEPIHIISLGAGVQSSTMALMAACGEITPMPKAAIFADTKAEPQSVYTWLDWLEKQLPFPVYRVTEGKGLTERITTIRTNKKTGNIYYSNMIPAYVLNADGSKGLVGRACTFDFKITPINRMVRKLAKIKRGQKTVGVVQWIGISLDEVQRMKESRDPWSKHIWPLIDKGMKRADCLRWMEKHFHRTPPRSACIYCPFRSDHEWRRLKINEPEAFAKAIDVEKKIQAIHKTVTTPGKFIGIPFLHASLKPIGEVDFSTEEERGQGNLFTNECEGTCGV